MRKLLIPEAVQTSAMDCGPASLKSLLEGFGISASYGRLREACQTDVDGSSIDDVEQAALQLGLDAEQVMLPLDHVLSSDSSALPAILIVRTPNGATHFVVAWRRHGSLIQVMDPGVGRRWTAAARLTEELYVHKQTLPAAAWREWAGTESFLHPLRCRIARLGATADKLVNAALRDDSPRVLATLDAATRMTEALAAAGAVKRGGEAARLLNKLSDGAEPIPEEYWSAGLDAANPDTVQLRGAVLLQVKGRRTGESTAPQSAELRAVLEERTAHPALEIWRTIRADGVLQPAMIVGALVLAASGTVVEALLLRGFFDLSRELTTAGQRAAGISILLAFAGALLLLDFALAGMVLRTGRRVEARLRLRFLAKIPLLNDRYFQSRPISDMAERCHSVHQLRQGPVLAASFMQALFGIALTVTAIGWLYPGALWPAIGVAAISAGIPLLARKSLAERDLRMRSHSGALSRYYLDGLQGLTAIRAHAAERSLSREQLALLGEWARAGFGMQRAAVVADGSQFGVSMAAAAWLVWSQLLGGGDVGGVLLLVYWVLNLPAMGQEMATAVWQYPAQKNTALRLLEPLGADGESVAATPLNPLARPVSIRLDNVTVRAAGITILEDVTLNIPPGAHVAIVGSSGAGKSSLVGLLLGWHRTAAGSLAVDDSPLDAASLQALRRQTAWVDPQVQIWNRSLYDNLRYGNDEAPGAMDEILEQAELRGVLEHLPEGLQTCLGEGGALVSGGEGQRVRLGRAMGRPHVRLVILDEPARGLDRERRRVMIERARQRWRGATLLCITHDVGDTQAFERVIVMERGAIVEDAAPRELARRPGSRYRQLLDAEDAVRRGLWLSSKWRRVRLAGGKLTELVAGSAK